MKKSFKVAIGFTLIVAMIISVSLVYAMDIGTTNQTVPFESSPTATLTGSSTSGAGTAASARDTILTSPQNIRIASATAGLNSTFVGHMTFEQDPSLFTIGWVDIKMRYSVAGGGATLTTDDMYRIEYTTVAAPAAGDWIIIQPNSQGTASNVALGGVTLARTWYNQLPNDGTWDWTDITDLKIRIFRIQKNSLDLTSHIFALYEVWATIYPDTVPLPPAASPALSIQPPVVPALANAFETFFVDIYARDMPALWGYQVRIDFNTTVLTPLEAWTYYPWNTETALPVLEDTLGYVEIAYATFFGDTVGFTGNSPIARIYFQVDEDPLNLGSGLPPTPNFSLLTFSISKLPDVAANPIPHNDYHGIYGDLPPDLMIFAGGTDLADPVSSIWTKIEPAPIEPGWHLSSWIDNDNSGILNPSDQVDMTDPRGAIVWLHVDAIWGVDQGGDPPVIKHSMSGTVKPPPPIPEFPLGIGVLMSIVALVPIVYMWRTRPKKKVA
ncbi:MAG TPA: cohesin domain-containing protein [Candidatus Bathyarchaeia archaeon]|nr:cohesin domain-containing protein [Candidatus Bathyarchaeia archaeon]